MARVSQGVILKTAKTTNPNAKYKLKYTYLQKSTSSNGITTTKYSYSKLITILTGKKYSYTI